MRDKRLIYDLPTYFLKYLKKLREEKRIEEGEGGGIWLGMGVKMEMKMDGPRGNIMHIVISTITSKNRASYPSNCS